MKFDNVVRVVKDARRIELPLGTAIVGFTVTHCDTRSPEYTRIRNRLTKPYRKLIEVDALPPTRDREIAIAAFIEHCVVGWDGVMSDGATVPYSPEACTDLLTQMPSLFYSLIEEANSADNFKPGEGDTGN